MLKYIVEARSDSGAIQFSPSLIHTGGESKSVRLALATDDYGDRAWFESYDHAQRICDRHEFGVDDGVSDCYWDYAAREWVVTGRFRTGRGHDGERFGYDG